LRLFVWCVCCLLSFVGDTSPGRRPGGS
jgi:hypothetical protein